MKTFSRNTLITLMFVALYVLCFLFYFMSLKNWNEAKQNEIETEVILSNNWNKEHQGISTFIENNKIEEIHRLFFFKKLNINAAFIAFLAILSWLYYWYLRSQKNILTNAENQMNFFHSITHEFKSPLTSLSLTLQTFKQPNLQYNQLLKLATNAESDIERLKNLIENILLSTKIENDYLPEPQLINLSVELNQVLQQILNKKTLLQNRKIESKIDENCFVKSSVFAIKTIAFNLIENAVKYSPDNTSIKINLNKKAEYILWEIIDEGEGIPRHERHQVFEKFYRINNASSHSKKGIGVGLYLVKKIVQQHDANIVIYDNHPRGTNFSIRFQSAE